VVRILVVDDHPGVRQAAAQLLVALGYEALTAGDPAEAEQILDREPSRIDVVMMDLFLGPSRGAALATRLEAQHQGLRVLFMSGHPRDEMLAMPDLLGPRRRFIEKPFSLAALGQAIDSLLRDQ
jgi:two-component system cell cycle sensor histidine kinase/response regulator CckA